LFLSGGIDSSIVAALMKRMVSEPIKTFSVGYQEASFSELSYARQVAGNIGSDHHEVLLGMSDFFEALPRLIWHEDEPTAWPSSVALYFVSQLAAKHVKVVLTGEGSDELFGGYGRYYYHHVNARWQQLYQHVPQGMRSAIRGTIETSPLLSASLRRKLNHTVLGRTGDLESLYLDNFYGPFSHSERERLLLSPESADLTYGAFRKYWNHREGGSLLDRLLYADQKTYLGKLLMKQDRMSMAASIESRVPFLDHTLVEFSTRIPSSLKLRGNSAKYLLKKACEGILPHEIIYRKKRGFPTPFKQWLLMPEAGPIYRSLLDSEGLLASHLDRKELESLLDRHQRGVEDATDRIWGLLNLQIWGDVFILKRQSRWHVAPTLQTVS
jgi:asparagine synthase (glutamine-hydrolysing)